MSSQAIEFNESYTADYPSAEGQAFEYRPVPVLAVIAMVLGILSSMAFFGITACSWPCIGIIISTISLLKIVRARENSAAGVWRRSAWPARSCSSVRAWPTSGTCISTKSRPVSNGSTSPTISQRRASSPSTASRASTRTSSNSSGKSVFLKGFMYPTNETVDLDSFLLVKDSGSLLFRRRTEADRHDWRGHGGRKNRRLLPGPESPWPASLNSTRVPRRQK